MRSLVVVVAVGCSSPAATRSTVSPAPAPTSPTPTTMPAFVATPATIPAPLELPLLQTLCSARPQVEWPKDAKRRFYEFMPFKLALAYGPPPTAAPAPPRTESAIRSAVLAQAERIAACLSYAKSRPTKGIVRRRIGRDGQVITLPIRMTIDPFGSVRDVVVDGSQAPETLAGCVKESLGALQVNRRTARETTVTAELELIRAEKAPALKQPPKPPDLRGRGGCIVTPDPLPVDVLALSAIEISMDPASQPPVRSRYCQHHIDKGDLRAGVTAILPALRGCYVAAAQPALAGMVKARFSVGPWAQAQDVVIEGAGDTALHGCMRTVFGAFNTAWAPDDSAVTVTVELELDPTPAAWTDSAAAINAYDTDGALALLGKDALAATTPDAACRARLGIVRALGTLPGGPTDRTMSAIEAFGAFAAAHDPAAVATCMADAPAIIEPIATWPIRRSQLSVASRWAGGGLAEAVTRSEAIIETVPAMRSTLLPFIGDAYVALHDIEAARRAYLAFFQLGIGDLATIERVSEGYARAVIERDHGVQPNVCEDHRRY